MGGPLRIPGGGPRMGIKGFPFLPFEGSLCILAGLLNATTIGSCSVPKPSSTDVLPLVPSRALLASSEYLYSMKPNPRQFPESRCRARWTSISGPYFSNARVTAPSSTTPVGSLLTNKIFA